MNQQSLRRLTCIAIAACGFCSANLYAGLFSSDDTIHITESKAANPGVSAPENAATLHIAGYSDERHDMPPKKIGVTTELVSGISGKNLVLDRDLTELTATSIGKRFSNAGFRLLDDGSALYELSGVIKELTYNVKARDEISIAIETTLKDKASGKIVWSGVVTEKDEHFAGISGNNKNDIANYLQAKLGVVTKKTFDAISATLMASRPDLFNLTPGTHPIDGVTVLQTAGTAPPAPATGAAKTGSPANGTLALTTKPARAKVYLDGVYFGMSPLRAEVEAGVHEVSVKAEKYKTASEKISVRRGDTTELELVLER